MPQSRARVVPGAAVLRIKPVLHFKKMFGFPIQFAQVLPYEASFTEIIVMVMIGLLTLILIGIFLMLMAAVLIAVGLSVMVAMDFIGGLFFPRAPSEADSQLTSKNTGTIWR